MKVAITGAKGTIGSVITNGLTGCDAVPLDLPEVDIRDYGATLEALRGCQVAIHLAWNLKEDNWDTGKISTDNDIMTFNVYEACLRGDVPRVIMASSVHADNFMRWTGKSLMTTSTIPVPTSPYGANKVFLEALGRFYAEKGLEVICIRFGSVNKNDVPGTVGWDWRKVWLSHRDLVEMIKVCIGVKHVPESYVALYGVSNNSLRVHDWHNPLGWEPRDDAYSVVQ